MICFEDIKVGDKVHVDSQYLQGAGEVTIVPAQGSYRHTLRMVAVRLAGGTASFWISPIHLRRTQ